MTRYAVIHDPFIVFDSILNVFKSSTGSVRLTLTETKTIRGVYIKFKGDARTEWYKEVRDESQQNRTKRRYYRGHEDLLDRTIHLVGGNQGKIEM